MSIQSGLQQAFKICFVSMIVAETHGRSDEVGGWHSDFEGNDSGGSEIGSDSDWTPDGQPNQKDRSEIKEESESPPLPSKPSKKKNRKIRVLNTECKFVGGSGTGTLLEDPEGNHYHKNQRRGDKVQWRCKFSKYGCRATASTHGFTLVSIRGEHNDHIKPVHGNILSKEDRLGRETELRGSRCRPNQHKEVRPWGVKAEFTRGKSGGIRLTDPMGEHYIKNGRRDNVVYYNCVKKRLGCKATAIIIDDILESTSGPHYHEGMDVHGNSKDSPRFKKRGAGNYLLEEESDFKKKPKNKQS